jgi:hypothetical protein
MDWDKFFKNQERFLKNSNEWTDDIIRGDGSIGIVPGSTADICRYDADEVEEVCRICGLVAMRVEVR